MAADFNPLDTTQRQKVLNVIGQLADAGLSEADIMRYFGITRDLGRQDLQNYFNAAQDQIGLSYQPELMNARNTLGANPLLADSGYANRLNRQLLTDIAARMSADYGSAASAQAQRNTDYLRDLYGQRIGYKTGLGSQAYQTMTGLPKKPSTGQQIASAGLQLVGAGAGAFLGRAPQQPETPGSVPSGAYTPTAPPRSYSGGYGPRRSMYRPFGDQ